PAVGIADAVPGELLGYDDLDLHDRLDDHRTRLRHGRLECHGARDLERHLVRVDLVRRAVHDGRLEVHHRIAGDDAVLHGLLDALLDGLRPFLREAVAADGRLVRVSRAARGGVEVDDHVAGLALAPGVRG